MYTEERYSAVMKNEITKLVGKWIDVKNVTSSKVTQVENDKHQAFYHMQILLLICMYSVNVKATESERGS